MEHFVTLFDHYFLPQGLALHASLYRHVPAFSLWVICMDDLTLSILNTLKLPNLYTIPLSEIETDELLAVKSSRSKGEYCWTLTPFTPKAIFDRAPHISRITYLDADLYILNSLSPIFREFEESQKHVLITLHAYAPEYDQSATSGIYCVQFMIFVRDKSEMVRRWWADRCLEWCFGRAEDGKFGDQKYLDDWPIQFEANVHVLQQKEKMLGPWNATRFPYSEAAVFHFHGLRLSKTGTTFGDYKLPQVLFNHVYTPYLNELTNAQKELKKAGWPLTFNNSPTSLYQKTLNKIATVIQRLKTRLNLCT